MGAVTTQLATAAESIFRELGYDIESAGSELKATRKWRTVYVTTDDPGEAPEYGRLRCFVVDDGQASTVREELLETDRPYDWAIVAVTENGYDVLHPDAGTLQAP